MPKDLPMTPTHPHDLSEVPTWSDPTTTFWNPWEWSDFDRTAARVAAGDVVRNPVYHCDDARSRALALRLDRALEQRGLRIDHPGLCIGFVVLMEDQHQLRRVAA